MPRIMSARFEDRVGDVYWSFTILILVSLLHLIHGPCDEVLPDGILAIENGGPGDHRIRADLPNEPLPGKLALTVVVDGRGLVVLSYIPRSPSKT